MCQHPYIIPKELWVVHSLKKVEPFDLWPAYLALHSYTGLGSGYIKNQISGYGFWTFGGNCWQWVLMCSFENKRWNFKHQRCKDKNQCTRSSSVPRLDSIIVIFAKWATPGAWYILEKSIADKNILSYLMRTDGRTDDGEFNSSPSSLREAGNNKMIHGTPN